MTENEISYKIIGASIELHKALGPGLLESVYEESLALDLRASGLKVKQQVSVPMSYKSLNFERGFRLDLLVEDMVIIEIKSVQAILPVHKSQLLTYLRLSDRRLGLLINFNSKVLKESIHRIANGL